MWHVAIIGEAGRNSSALFQRGTLMFKWWHLIFPRSAEENKSAVVFGREEKKRKVEAGVERRHFVWTASAAQHLQLPSLRSAASCRIKKKQNNIFCLSYFHLELFQPFNVQVLNWARCNLWRFLCAYSNNNLIHIFVFVFVQKLITVRNYKQFKRFYFMPPFLLDVVLVRLQMGGEQQQGKLLFIYRFLFISYLFWYTGLAAMEMQIWTDNAKSEWTVSLPPVCKCGGSVAPCWAQLLARKGQLHRQLRAQTL